MRRVDNSTNTLQLGLDQFVARFSTGWKARAIWYSTATADDLIADPPALSDDALLMLDGRILHEAVLTYATIGSTGATGSELRQAVGLNTASFTGAGVKVGVLSDSFNNLGGAAQDEASGELPPGGSDRGAIGNGGRREPFGTAWGIGISTTVNGGGYDVVNAGPTASGAIVNSGTQFVFGGGSASGTTLNSGLQIVLGGGTTSATTVNNGGQVGI